jgi:hypothetical protein
VGSGPALRTRWTCASINPGRIVQPVKVRSIASLGRPASATASPRPAATIRSPSMMITPLSMGSLPVPSIRRLARRTIRPMNPSSSAGYFGSWIRKPAVRVCAGWEVVPRLSRSVSPASPAGFRSPRAACCERESTLSTRLNARPGGARGRSQSWRLPASTSMVRTITQNRISCQGGRFRTVVTRAVSLGSESRLAPLGISVPRGRSRKVRRGDLSPCTRASIRDPSRARRMRSRA